MNKKHHILSTLISMSIVIVLCLTTILFKTGSDAKKKTLNGKTITMTVGETKHLNVYSDFGYKGLEKLKWNTSNKKICAIKKGHYDFSVDIKAKKAGKAKITAKAGKKKFKVTIKVKKKKVDPTPTPRPVGPPITAAQAGCVQMLRNYIKTNGSINKNGHKMIQNSFTSDNGAKITYAIINDTSIGCINYLYNTEGNGSAWGDGKVFTKVDPYTSLSIPVSYPSTDVKMSVASASASALYNISTNVYISEFKKQNSIFFFKDSKDEELNTMINQGCAYWDALLREKVGFGLYELGFIGYI